MAAVVECFPCTAQIYGTSLQLSLQTTFVYSYDSELTRAHERISICYPANLQSTFSLLALVPVRSFEIVDPRNVNALRFHNKNELTLITCYPFSYIGPAPKRFIVHAEPVRAPEKCSQS